MRVSRRRRGGVGNVQRLAGFSASCPRAQAVDIGVVRFVRVVASAST